VAPVPVQGRVDAHGLAAQYLRFELGRRGNLVAALEAAAPEEVNPALLMAS
jgi:hypothetical protein